MVDDTHLSRWVEQDRRLDHAHRYLAKFRHLVPEGGTVIDAGTSIGDHTVTYASWVGPNGQVIGFEANPDVAECCSLNLGIYPWARCLNVGLSNENGVAGVAVNPNVGASHVTKDVGDGIVHTKLAKLDDFIDEVTRCDFMKVDIEGYEPAMLLGATEFLKKYSPPMLMEVNRAALGRQGYSTDEFYTILRGLGYHYVVADGVFGSEQYDILAQKA